VVVVFAGVVAVLIGGFCVGVGVGAGVGAGAAAGVVAVVTGGGVAVVAAAESAAFFVFFDFDVVLAAPSLAAAPVEVAEVLSSHSFTP
jgi:hypothetical protein